jgi:phosphoglycolate phosphatase
MTLQHLELQAAIIDLDGTLIHTLGDFEVALNRVLETLGLPAASSGLIERSVGKGSSHLVHAVVTHQLTLLSPASRAMDPASLQRLLKQAEQLYQQHYNAVNGQYATLYPGVLEGLQQLTEAGLRLACVTNKPLTFALGLLEQKGLRRFFEKIYGGDSFERRKPDPLPLQKTCAALGTPFDRTLMVGDSSNDAQAAGSAGCPVVLMTYGYNHGEPIRNTPALAWLDSLAELAPMLLRHREGSTPRPERRGSISPASGQG